MAGLLGPSSIGPAKHVAQGPMPRVSRAPSREVPPSSRRDGSRVGLPEMQGRRALPIAAGPACRSCRRTLGEVGPGTYSSNRPGVPKVPRVGLPTALRATRRSRIARPFRCQPHFPTRVGSTHERGTGDRWTNVQQSRMPIQPNLRTGLKHRVQIAFLLLTLATFALCLTMFWFNRPRFLVPARYRDTIGRWEERRRERSSR